MSKMNGPLQGRAIINELTRESKLLEEMDECDAELLLDWMGNAIDGKTKMAGASVTHVIHKLAARGGVIQGDYR